MEEGRPIKIAIAGLGYVGASYAALLSSSFPIAGYDVDESRVAMASKGDFSYLGEHAPRANNPNLSATTDPRLAFEDADYVFLCVPTDFDEKKRKLDTSILDELAKTVLSIHPNSVIILKSTVPLGYSESLIKRYPDASILFCPEFLRESSSFDDAASPSRVIIGGKKKDEGKIAGFCRVLRSVLAHEPTILVMEPSEAEAVKLFSNSYLALRVSFFNELDSLALSKGMDAKRIIEGVCLDPRIGESYSNPSFGYGGICLPKDSKELHLDFDCLDEDLILASLTANAHRKAFLAEDFAKRFPVGDYPIVGVYGLFPENGRAVSENSPLFDVVNLLREKGYRFLFYSPRENASINVGGEITSDLSVFKRRCDVILADRMDKNLDDVAEKVYTRDLRRRG